MNDVDRQKIARDLVKVGHHTLVEFICNLSEALEIMGGIIDAQHEVVENGLKKIESMQLLSVLSNTEQ